MFTICDSRQKQNTRKEVEEIGKREIFPFNENENIVFKKLY
jgi:hypothetical protein